MLIKSDSNLNLFGCITPKSKYGPTEILSKSEFHAKVLQIFRSLNHLHNHNKNKAAGGPD